MGQAGGEPQQRTERALRPDPARSNCGDRDWRRLMADQMAEALAVLKAADIPAASTTPLPVWMTPHILRLPTPLFTRIAAKMLTIDPSARTSMAYDVMEGRPTEIDSLQGEIIRLGKTRNTPTPINLRNTALIRNAPRVRESPPIETLSRWPRWRRGKNTSEREQRLALPQPQPNAVRIQ